MIIYGSRTKMIEHKFFKDECCEECGGKGKLSFGLLSYSHVFWIPTFVYRKRVGLLCSNCGSKTTHGLVPEEIRYNIERNVFTRDRILPYFTGSIIMGILLVLALIIAR